MDENKVETVETEVELTPREKEAKKNFEVVADLLGLKVNEQYWDVIPSVPMKATAFMITEKGIYAKRKNKDVFDVPNQTLLLNLLQAKHRALSDEEYLKLSYGWDVNNIRHDFIAIRDKILAFKEKYPESQEFDEILAVFEKHRKVEEPEE